MISTTDPQQSQGRGDSSYSSGSLPASNANVVSPTIIMFTVQSLPFILTTNPSYSGFAFEKLVIVNAIRRDTLIGLSFLRLTSSPTCIKNPTLPQPLQNSFNTH